MIKLFTTIILQCTASFPMQRSVDCLCRPTAAAADLDSRLLSALYSRISSSWCVTDVSVACDETLKGSRTARNETEETDRRFDVHVHSAVYFLLILPTSSRACVSQAVRSKDVYVSLEWCINGWTLHCIKTAKISTMSSKFFYRLIAHDSSFIFLNYYRIILIKSVNHLMPTVAIWIQI